MIRVGEYVSIPINHPQLTGERKTILKTTLQLTWTTANSYNNWQGKEKTLQFYFEQDGQLFVPRAWALTTPWIVDAFYRQQTEQPIDLWDGQDSFAYTRFERTLKDYQQNAVDEFILPSLQKKHVGGVLALAPGLGKTITWLYLVYKLRRKALFVLPTSPLMTQAAEEIEKVLPEARVGYLYGTIVDIQDKDIVLTTYQSLSLKSTMEYHPGIMSQFGFVTFDECHHTSSMEWSKCIEKVRKCHYLLGLSGTPNRKDGNHVLFDWFLGPVLYEKQRGKDALSKVKVEIHHYHPEQRQPNQHQQELKIVKCRDNNLNISRMISDLCAFEDRCEWISQILLRRMMQEPRRRWLLIGDRNEFLIDMERRLRWNVRRQYQLYVMPTLKKKYPRIASLLYLLPFTKLRLVVRTIPWLQRKVAYQFGELVNSGLLLGSMEEDEREENKKRAILFTNSQLGGEGFNGADKNTGAFLTPYATLDQIGFRIIRKDTYTEEDVIPIWLDFWDHWSVFENYGYCRQNFYKKHEFQIIHQK